MTWFTQLSVPVQFSIIGLGFLVIIFLFVILMHGVKIKSGDKEIETGEIAENDVKK